jgi:hypothetical protein
MKVLAVTCYTGSRELCDMTANMLTELKKTVKNTELKISVTAQGAARPPLPHLDYQTIHPENVSFAFGMNRAIAQGLDFKPDYVLCLNNDLEFPQANWFTELARVARSYRVVCPATDKTALYAQKGPISMGSMPVEEMSAYCWMVPFEVCEILHERYGFWLFCEDFKPAYGEDNWTAYLIAKILGHRPFRVVRKSFVKHLRRKTSSVVPHDRSKTSKILADKMRAEMRDPNLRCDLRVRAEYYLKALKC